MTHTTEPSPYRSGMPVDSIPHKTLPSHLRAIVHSYLRQLDESLNWLATGTLPDILVITSILAKHQCNPSPGHINAAKHVIKYLKGTANFGIYFCSDSDPTLSSFIHFPINKYKLVGITDANWGPQDQSVPNEPIPKSQELFKSRSISGYIISLNFPLHWTAKRQKIKARRSAEAEIYATDECCKDILSLIHLIQDLNLDKILLSEAIPIYNNNMVCVQWIHNKTTKSIRHIQIRENTVQESVQDGTVIVLHVAGELNPTDIFTKEDEETTHFIIICKALV